MCNFCVYKWKQCFYKRFKCFKNFNELFMYLFRQRKRGCSNACVCMGTYSQPLLQNHLMDVYETWYGWSSHDPAHALRCFGHIRPGAGPGWGKNRSKGLGVPSSKNFFFRQEGNSNKPKHVKWSVVVFGSIQKSNFLHVNLAYLQKCSLYSGERSVPLGALVFNSRLF